MLTPPFPELDDLLHMMGQAGQHLAEIEASEGAAGNISVCLRWPLEPRTRFPVVGEIELPQAVPELAGDVDVQDPMICQVNRRKVAG
jgi:rhamnulose-1-phosphate aldolase